MTDQTNPYRLPGTIVPSAYRIELTPDLKTFKFTGRVAIDVDVHTSTKELRLNAADLELSTATFTANEKTWTSGPATLEDQYETATYAFAEALPVGPGTIEITFTGTLNDQLRGFYRSTYTDGDGNDRIIATTQFESHDARRAFPCWDEPAMKATYQVTLTVPSDLAAYSNTAALEETDLGNGTRRVEFAPTMKMSTYLVAFVVGPFEATDPVDVLGTDVRIIYPIGKGHLTAYPLEVAVHALTFFTDYFGIPYPGDKYDCIAIPDFAAGAMENLGLVTYREADLLIDPERASFDQIERVALVINHETAHMWFGDLVTMDWWEGIWLNEAFATFMESLCTDHFRPQWRKWATFFPFREFAMDIDAMHSTRAIEYEVVSPNDCRGMFDALTYYKGCAVLRMLEQYLGPDTFRDGIRQYLNAHAYGNTVTADLWAALEGASGQPVGQIMDTWILQGGFPLVSYESQTLSQAPFSFTAATGPSAIGERWQVPILTRTLGQSGLQKLLLKDASMPAALAPATVVNAYGAGFFRVAYGDAELGELSARLTDLDEVERTTLVSDTWASTMLGRTSVTSFLKLIESLGDADETSTWGVVGTAFMTLNRVVDDEGRTALQAAVTRIMKPQLDRLGWDPVAGESEQRGKLRAQSIELLGIVGRDAATITEALKRFDQNQIPGDLLPGLVRIAAMANRPGDEELFEARRKAAPTPQEEQTYLFAPAFFTDVDRAMRLLNRCFDGIRTQDAPFVIMQAMGNRVTGPAVWRAYTARWDEILEKFPDSMPSSSFRTVATFIGDPDFAREVQAFHESHPLEIGQRSVDQALERMGVGVAFGERVRPTVAKQIAAALP